jgi:Tol biopolymer transport system component
MLSPSEKLGRYEVLSPLGAGGMGEVYRARDTELQREVALKILPQEFSSDPDRVMRFEREAKATAALSHPNVLTVFDVGRDDRRTYLVFEMLEGSTLAEVMKSGGLRTREALDYAGQVARGLAAAHAQGVVHRDVKPANLFLTTTGIVKILDFGLARIRGAGSQHSEEATAEVTGPGLVLGTVSYMSPEQARGEPLDARSDLFSLGTVLYEMLCGRHPFRRGSWSETASAILRDAPAELGRLEGQAPRAVKRLVGRCLEKRPEDRFQTANDLALALDVLYRGEEWAGTASSASPVTKEVEAGPATSSAPARSRRWLWLGAGLAGLLAMAAAAWLLLRPPLPTPRVVQLTSMRGYERDPSLSPDGTQVAFFWRGEKLDNPDIYIMQIGSPEVRRLTTDPAPDQAPCWSPDGRQIAFTRRRPGGMATLQVVSPLGGSDRKLADFAMVSVPSWSPDGRWLVVARTRPGGEGPLPGWPSSDGLFLIPAEGGEPRSLALGPVASQAFEPRFSPNGRQLAYVSCTGFLCHVEVVELGADFQPEGPPRRLTRRPVFALGGLAWSPDGRALIFVDYRTARLWRVPIGGNGPATPIELAGPHSLRPSTAASRDRLVYIHMLGDADVYRFEAERPAEPVLASSSADFGPSFSPDGRRVAFESDRSLDGHEIWLADADGTHSVQLTRGPGMSQGSPSWSPDGLRIAFDSQGEDGHVDIWVIDADGGPAGRLTHRAGDQFLPSWSRDGRFVYFASRLKDGSHDVWRVPAAGGAEERITHNGGMLAHESIDGRTLYFLRQPEGGPLRQGDAPLLSLPLGGGTERQIVACASGFAVGPGGVYYVECSSLGKPEPSLVLWNPATGRGRPLGKVGGASGGLAISPDGRTILYTKEVGSGSDLMMIENFR